MHPNNDLKPSIFFFILFLFMVAYCVGTLAHADTLRCKFGNTIIVYEGKAYDLGLDMPAFRTVTGKEVVYSYANCVLEMNN
jgi:hypothetical protein